MGKDICKMYKIDTCTILGLVFDAYDEPLFHSSWLSVCLLHVCKFNGRVPSARSRCVELSKEDIEERSDCQCSLVFQLWVEKTQADQGNSFVHTCA